MMMKESPTKPETVKDLNSNAKQSPLDQLASLRRLLMTDEDTRPCVNGVLTVCVKDFHAHEGQNAAIISRGCYCSILLRNITKSTHVVSKQDGIYAWNQTKHFSVIVRSIPKNRKHPFNLIKIQVYQVSNPTMDSDSNSMGSVSFHMHDIISASPISSTFDVRDQHRLVGAISVELTFNYGSFGYGYSPQLKEEKRSASEMVACSLFPRIITSLELDDTSSGDEDTVAHPSYIPFNEKVLLGYGRDLNNSVNISTEKQYVPDMIAKDLSHLKAVRDQYATIGDRVERVLFLQNYINGTDQNPEVILDQQDPPIIPPRIKSMYVQPFNLNASIKDTVLFRALERRRDAAAKRGQVGPVSRPSPSGSKGPRTRAVLFSNTEDE